MEVESIMVTGANRGIGLEFVKQLVGLTKPPKYLFATYRSKDTVQVLEEIRDSCLKTKVVLIQLDVTKKEDLEAARKTVEETVKDNGLNLLINNAGALRLGMFPEILPEDMSFHYCTNTIGPLMIFQEMFPLLQKAAARKSGPLSFSRAGVLNISSTGGSCGAVDESQSKLWLAVLAYRSSKSALNMAMRIAALVVKDQGILVVQMCPGWVKTELGTDQAQISSTESIKCMLDTLPKLDESNAGAFLDRNGDTIPF